MYSRYNRESGDTSITAAENLPLGYSGTALTQTEAEPVSENDSDIIEETDDIATAENTEIDTTLSETEEVSAMPTDEIQTQRLYTRRRLREQPIEKSPDTTDYHVDESEAETTASTGGENQPPPPPEAVASSVKGLLGSFSQKNFTIEDILLAALIILLINENADTELILILGFLLLIGLH